MAFKFKYNPGFHDDSEIVENFVVRLDDLALILDVVRDNVRAAANRHVLIVGPRGAGKTTLVRRVVAEVHNDGALKSYWLPIVFGEESYNITNAGEFWLEAIYHLDKQLDDAHIHQAYEHLSDETDDKKLREDALEFLVSYSKQIDKRLILVLENFNMLFDHQMSNDEGWVLRHTLQNVQEIMLLATATTSFEEVEHADRALFEQFKTHHLRMLSAKDCATLWNHFTGETLAPKKLRPIQILTGGSPRLVRIVCEYAVEKSFLDLMSKLSILVDQYTDYFKSQLEALPVKERKVFVSVLELWDPVTTKEVAECARMPVNAVSALLGRLHERGALAKLSAGSIPRWQAAERLFNIYYLMRRRGAPSSRVFALVKFMTVYYETEQLAEEAAALARETCSLAPDRRLDHFMALSELMHQISPGKRNEVLRIIPEEVAKDPTTPTEFSLLWEGGTQDIIAPDQKFATKSIRRLRNTIEFADAAFKLIENGQVQQAIDRCLKRLEQYPEEYDVLLALGAAYERSDDAGKAEEYYGRALAIEPESSLGWSWLGGLLAVQERYGEAIDCFNRAINLKPNSGSLWRKLALLLERNGASAERVEECLQKAVSLAPRKAVSWISLGKWKWRHSGASAAAEALRKAVRVEPDSSKAWETLADWLQQRREFVEAEKAILRAKAVKKDEPVLWSKLADILSHIPGRKKEAIGNYERAVLLSEEKKSSILCSFGRYLDQNHEHKRAETLFRKATTAEPKDPRSWFFLGHHLWARGAKELLQEAESALRKAVEISPKFARAWSDLGVVLDLQDRHDDAEAAFRHSIELSGPCEVRHRLGLFFISRNRRKEAIECFKKTVCDHPECVCSARRLASLLSEDGLDGEAKRVLVELVEKAPQAGPAHAALAEFIKDSDPEGAKAEFFKALTFAPTKVDLPSKLSNLILKTAKDNNDAIEELKKVTQLIKDDAEAMNAVAWVVHKHSKTNSCDREMFEFAASLAKNALEIEPASWPTRHTLSFLLLDNRRVDQALQEIKALANDLTEDYLEDFIELCVALGGIEPSKLLAIIAESNAKEAIEPLVAALRIVLGQSVNVAQEILEVARDLAKQMKVAADERLGYQADAEEIL